jgi:hypothetical protein
MKSNPNPKQNLFQEMTLGILIYAVVLGFFEDYTNIISTWSYSVTFFVAIVMQILTYITFWLKSKIVNRFKGKEGKKYLAVIIFAVWMVMFFSKFVFLFVIDFIFRDSVKLSGFLGLIIIIVTMTIVKKLIDVVYIKLSNN